MATSTCPRSSRRSGRKSRKDVEWSTVQQRRYALKAISTRLGTDPDDDSFDHFLGVFKGVLVDLGVPDGKVGELITVFEGERAQVLNR